MVRQKIAEVYRVSTSPTLSILTDAQENVKVGLLKCIGILRVTPGKGWFARLLLPEQNNGLQFESLLEIGTR
jgi:hypothetical protein